MVTQSRVLIGKSESYDRFVSNHGRLEFSYSTVLSVLLLQFPYNTKNEVFVLAPYIR